MTAKRTATRAWDVLGVLLLVVAVAALPRQFLAPIDVYDEGLLLTHAEHVLRGAVPYRDFYANYPPGALWLVAAAWKVTGVSVFVARLLGLAIHVAVAVLAARLAARALAEERSGGDASSSADPRAPARADAHPGAASGRGADPSRAPDTLEPGRLGVSWLVLGATFLWLRHGPIWPTAWLGGLACALLAFELAAGAGASRARWFASGLAFGAIALLRHDLCVYAALGFGGALVASRLVRRPLEAPRLVPALAFLGGALVVPALAGGWILSVAGWRQPYLDLYHDQVTAMLPARILPIPALWHPERIVAGLWIGFLAPLAWIAGLLVGRRSIAWTGLGVLALAGLPQMTNRVDLHHVVYGLAPGIALLGVTLARPPWGSTALRYALGVPVVVLLVAGATGTKFRPGREWTPLALERAGIARARNAELARARERVVGYVRAHTGPDERIFVGNHQHARVFVCEMDLYFLAGRLGGVRRMQFDPNLTNRADEQERMIHDLDERAVRVVVLAPDPDPREPNDSAKIGSNRFDVWLSERFELAEVAGPYRILRRRE